MLLVIEIKGQFWKLVLFFYHVGHKDQTHVWQQVPLPIEPPHLPPILIVETESLTEHKAH